MTLNRNTALIAFVVSAAAGMLGMRLLENKIVPEPPAIQKDSAASEIERPKANAGAVRVEMYVMSQCPYGVQAVDGIKPALDKLGRDVDFTMDFVGQGTSPSNLTSMHGPKEVTGDIVQLCAAKHAPDKYMDMVVCQNKNYREVDTNWERCASENGIAASEIRTCLEGGEGRKLLAASFARAAKRGATGSPTIYVNGQSYQGGRKGNDFLKAICKAASTKPAACQAIPEAKPVNVFVLGDKRCPDCETDKIAEGIKSKIEKPVLKVLDYGDPDGRKLYDEIKPGALPIVAFDGTLREDADSWEELGGSAKPAGSYSYIPAGGEWMPACADADGCSKAECKESIACRKEVPNKLEVFVMSQCPYGVKALDAMQEVLKSFGDKLEFSIQFIGDGDAATGLTSMHGQAEVDENLREICAFKHYAKKNKFMDYIWCRNKDIRSADWKKCTGGTTGIDTAKIQKCSEGDEGKKLLEASYKLASSMGIGGSPTWMANNKHKFSGIDAETVRKNVCQHNASLKGCDKKLSGSSGPPVEGGCGK